MAQLGDDVKKSVGNIETIISSIQSALKEQDGIISTSFDTFHPVLTADLVRDSDEPEKAVERSDVANVLTTIRDCIVSNNKLINLNSRCDL